MDSHVALAGYGAWGALKRDLLENGDPWLDCEEGLDPRTWLIY